MSRIVLGTSSDIDALKPQNSPERCCGNYNMKKLGDSSNLPSWLRVALCLPLLSGPLPTSEGRRAGCTEPSPVFHLEALSYTRELLAMQNPLRFSPSESKLRLVFLLSFPHHE